MASLFAGIRKELGKLDGWSEEDADRLVGVARDEAAQEERRLKEAVQQALADAREQLLTDLQDKGPETNDLLVRVLQEIEQRVSQALASDESTAGHLQPATDESGQPTRGAGQEPGSGPAYAPSTLPGRDAPPGPDTPVAEEDPDGEPADQAGPGDEPAAQDAVAQEQEDGPVEDAPVVEAEDGAAVTPADAVPAQENQPGDGPEGQDGQEPGSQGSRPAR